MRLELLVVPHCPHEEAARQVLADALTLLGLSTGGIETVTIASESAAREWGFAGSPSFFIDGQDVFALPHPVAALACRLYRGDRGKASGVPGAEQLADAIRLLVSTR